MARGTRRDRDSPILSEGTEWDTRIADGDHTEGGVSQSLCPALRTIALLPAKLAGLRRMGLRTRRQRLRLLARFHGLRNLIPISWEFAARRTMTRQRAGSVPTSGVRLTRKSTILCRAVNLCSWWARWRAERPALPMRRPSASWSIRLSSARSTWSRLTPRSHGIQRRNATCFGWTTSRAGKEGAWL